jgi:acetylornithine deacetylase
MTGATYQPVEMIRRLVSFDTTSRESNLGLIDFVAEYLDGHGVASTLIRGDEGRKANLFATIGPPRVPGIILSGHTDVVPVDGQDWSTDPFALHEAGGKLFGRGTADMKSFIAVALALVPDMLARRLSVPIHLALSYDEEVGCLGVHGMIGHIETGETRPRICIVGEPTSMRVVNAHKGVYSFRTLVRGLEAHSSATHAGVNAIMYAGELIAYLGRLAEEMRGRAQSPSRFEPPYTSVHVGLVRGGTALNIIPRECSFIWEYRLLPGEDADEIPRRFEEFAKTEIEPRMRAVDPATGIDTEMRARIPALTPEVGSPAESLVMALAGTNRLDAVSYGTEAGIFQDAEIPTVVCGPGDIAQAHRPDEFIALEQVDACTAFLRRLIDYAAAD